MGCEECTFGVCNDLVKFKAIYLTTKGQMVFVILFSKPLTQLENVTSSLFNVTLQPKIYIEA